jgi:alanine transaminase
MPAAAMNDTINPKVKEAEYAVRGAITQRAAEIEKEINAGKGNYPFDKVLYCNIGNPQQLDQKPIAYPRQLLACCEYPEVRDAATFSVCCCHVSAPM